MGFTFSLFRCGLGISLAGKSYMDFADACGMYKLFIIVDPVTVTPMLFLINFLRFMAKKLKVKNEVPQKIPGILKIKKTHWRP
jgi:hypothetical protein